MERDTEEYIREFIDIYLVLMKRGQVSVAHAALMDRVNGMAAELNEIGEGRLL